MVGGAIVFIIIGADFFRSISSPNLGVAREIRLGRGSNADELIEPKTVQDIIDCLKRIQSSIKLWTKKNGRKGYLEYISKFIN